MPPGSLEAAPLRGKSVTDFLLSSAADKIALNW
jgi:uncharacterized protein (DUF1778 family)